MMRALRDKRLMHVVMWTLVFVFVSFIFFSWGMKSSLSNRKDPNLLAQIGDETINYADFNKVYQPAADRLYNAREESPSAEEIKQLKERVLDRLVEDAVLRQTALKFGLSVPDEELAGYLQHQSYFLDNTGKFDKKKYLQILEANHLSPDDFEASQREEMLLQKIRSLLQDSVLSTHEDLKNFAVLVNRDLKADYAAINLGAFEKKISPSDADLRNYYESNKNRYDHVERVKVRHILINLQGNESMTDQEKAKASLLEYRKDLQAKKITFAEAAKKYSQDDGSKDHGGELGWVSRNGMSKDLSDFESALFKLKKGEISQPIKSKFGYHLAQAEDYEPEYKSRFSEVREKVLKQYRQEKAAQQAMALSGQLADRLKNKENLSQAAQALGLTVQTTGWFTGNSGIPSVKGSRKIAEELADLYPQEWKGPLEAESSLNSKGPAEADQTEYFFQITGAQEHSGDSERVLGGNTALAQRLDTYRQEIWLKDFLAEQRKKLNVKTFLNG